FISLHSHTHTHIYCHFERFYEIVIGSYIYFTNVALPTNTLTFDPDPGPDLSYSSLCHTENTTCSPESFKCPGSNKCISRRWLCDGDRDCPDGGDESVLAGCGE